MDWIDIHRADIDGTVAETTSHDRLAGIEMYPDDRNLFLRLSYEQATLWV